ncbi:hypothetical protein EMPG_15142 [Blastomyces silverae]|uniref:Secreted protein n=1 Tax=Blastomyces silverae TaxID=2060906 RepID=A0A0H1BEJ1_9EURO|nr:hypothetical protein EMPG_15142 [Blastomyces silverae]
MTRCQHINVVARIPTSFLFLLFSSRFSELTVSRPHTGFNLWNLVRKAPSRTHSFLSSFSPSGVGWSED